MASDRGADTAKEDRRRRFVAFARKLYDQETTLHDAAPDSIVTAHRLEPADMTRIPDAVDEYDGKV